MKTRLLSLTLAVAGVALVAYAGYEQEGPTSKTEENPKCTSSGGACETRICTQIFCFSGVNNCTPTEWDCGEWEAGTCKKILWWYSCVKN